MQDLLGVHLGAILHVTVDGLPQDGIEGLQKGTIDVEAGDGGAHDQLETLDFVGHHARAIQVQGKEDGRIEGAFEGTVGDAGLDGKGDARQVQVTAEDLAPHLRDDILGDRPHRTDQLLVAALLATILAGHRMTRLIGLVGGYEVLRQLQDRVHIGA